MKCSYTIRLHKTFERLKFIAQSMKKPQIIEKLNEIIVKDEDGCVEYVLSNPTIEQEKELRMICKSGLNAKETEFLDAFVEAANDVMELGEFSMYEIKDVELEDCNKDMCTGYITICVNGYKVEMYIAIDSNGYVYFDNDVDWFRLDGWNRGTFIATLIDKIIDAVKFKIHCK